MMKVISIWLLFCASVMATESGPGNGTDYVKVLFADAQYDVLRLLTPVAAKDLPSVGLSKEVESWLLEANGDSVRFERLKYFLRKMDLQFQQEPCSDFSGKPASICFFDDAASGPYVLISLKENKMTTKDQAMAMLIHEAGHFTGEKNHLFLDKVGVELVHAVRLPGVLIADAQVTEIVADPFGAKANCDAGTSSQAKSAKNQAVTNLLSQCSVHGVSCDTQKAEIYFQGSAGFRDGSGFDMKVTCAARVVLRLK